MLYAVCVLAACQAGSAIAGLDPEDPALNPIIVSIDLRTARAVYASDEGVLIESKGRTNTGQTVDADTEWLALDGGEIVAVSDGSKAMFGSKDPGTYRVVGKGKGWGKGGNPSGSGDGDPEPEPVDTIQVTIEPPPSPLASISVTPSASDVYWGWTKLFAVSGTRSDGSSASPAVTWRATCGTVDAGGYYIAPQTDGTCRIIATTTDGALADTAVATVSKPPTNEPAGFTPIFENNFGHLPGTGNDLYGRSTGFYRGGELNMTLKSDPSGPKSTSSTLQTRWPEGLEGGTGPGAFWFWGNTRDKPYRQLYVSFYAKIPTADFENHAVYTKLLYFAHGNIDGQRNDDVIGLGGDGSTGPMSAMRIIFSQSQADDRTGHGSGMPRYQNVDTRPLFTVGEWHHVEVYANVGTPDAYNGIARVWVDGILVTERKDLKFLETAYGYTQGFFEGQWTPVWGGVGGTKTRDDFLLLDHLYVSGKE
jgi:hypothetical protein